MNDGNFHGGEADAADASIDAAETRFGEDDDAKNPGVEQVRQNLSPFANKFDGFAASAAGQDPTYDPEIFDSKGEAADPTTGPQPEYGGTTAGQANEIGPNIDWAARELRTESLRLAARNHQGRGIPVEMLIDEAKIYAAYLETGEVPDFSY